jgi:hypothetical protein
MWAMPSSPSQRSGLQDHPGTRPEERADHSPDLSLSRKADPAESRYGGAVDVKRAADLYAQGWTLRQIVPSWAFIGARSANS